MADIPQELNNLADLAKKHNQADKFVEDVKRSTAWSNANRILKSGFNELRLRPFGDKFVVENENGQTLAPAVNRQTAIQSGSAAIALKKMGVNSLTEFHSKIVGNPVPKSPIRLDYKQIAAIKAKEKNG